MRQLQYNVVQGFNWSGADENIRQVEKSISLKMREMDTDEDEKEENNEVWNENEDQDKTGEKYGNSLHVQQQIAITW